MKKIETLDIAQLSTVTGGWWNANVHTGPLRRGDGPIVQSPNGAYYCAKDIGEGWFDRDPICAGKKFSRFD